MEWLILLGVVLIVAIAIAAKLAPTSKPAAVDDLPYVKSAALFTPAERSFLGVLDQATGAGYRVFGKVRVADVVDVKTSDRGRWQRAFNRISSKHFDFVVCDGGDLSVVCVIELDDRSHQGARRQERDGFLSEVCRVAGIPLIQVPARRAYSTSELRAQLADVLNPSLQDSTGYAMEQANSVAPAAPNAAYAPSTESAALEVALNPERAKSEAESQLACPVCASPMIRRQGKSGRYAGAEFWGCTRYPKCRGMVPISSGDA
jgi:hypothetical protein